MSDKIEEIVNKHLSPAEMFIYGFANLTVLLDNKFRGFDYGISIGKLLDDSIVDKIIDGPTMEYYAHYKQINEDLALLSNRISQDLNRKNIETYSISPTVSTKELDTIYHKTLRTELSHKMVATRAGLGWIGKTDLLVTKKFGPRLRLTTILIKEMVRLKTKPMNRSRCGTCTICIEKCPAKAANGKVWNTTVDRDVYFDAHKCRNQCIAFGRERLSEGARVCGICVAVCPVGQ
ncbi:MAG TPA: 4Fe-4S double cluster binding domain-containing protein [Bacteroidales bacterium]|nr:4Fe-4S double cluster binding domain-containing protein [Bacteroidales bacterium]